MQPGMPREALDALASLASFGGPFAAMAAARDKYDALIVEAAESHDALSQRGWGVVNLPMPLLAKATALANDGDGDAADALLAEQWDDAVRTSRVVARVGVMGSADPTMRDLAHRRRRLLMKARELHHSAVYAASVPMVLAQVEGITADATEGLLFFSKSPSKAADLQDPSRLVSISAGLPAARLPYIVGVNQTQAKGSLSRHGILHGRELAYDTKVISAKCWSLLDAVVEWALPVVAAIAQRKVDERRAARADSPATNQHGQRLDDREFIETREALRWVSTVQLGQHRNRGRFHPDVVNGWLGVKDFTKRGLPEDHGVTSRVNADGSVWWAWRTTVSGWVLGIANVAVGDSFHEYLYAGPELPGASPLESPDLWGEVWGTPPDWQSLEEE